MRIAFLLLLFAAACTPVADVQREAAPAGLDGTSWTLTAIRGNPVVAGSSVTLEFAQDDASGNGGCNQYRGAFSTEGSTLSIGPTIATKRACADRAMNAQETAYLEALSHTAKYEISGNRLVLRDAGNGALLEYTRQR
jgi:heat shock protein HslJ